MKTIEQLEQTIGNINKDMNNNKKQSDEKISGLLYENEKVKEQNKSLSSTIDTMKNEQSRLKDITKDTISDMKRMEKDMEMVQQRYDTLEKEYNNKIIKDENQFKNTFVKTDVKPEEYTETKENQINIE